MRYIFSNFNTVTFGYLSLISYFSNNPTAIYLREHFLLSGLFYLALLPAVFKASLGGGSLTSKLAGLHVDLWNIAPARLFVWITTIQKKVTPAGQSRNINLYGELVLRNVSFEMFASNQIWTLFTVGEHVSSLMFYLFG